MIVNAKKIKNEYVVIVCDSRDLLGKKLGFFIKGEKKEYNVKPQYYNGEEKNKEEIKKQMENATILDLLGEESVNLGKEMGKIKDVLTMYDKEKEVPYALWFLT